MPDNMRQLVFCLLVLLSFPLFAENLPASFFQEEGRMYVVDKDYNLNSKIVNVADGCRVKFEGGSLCNGELKGNNTQIEANYQHVFKDGLKLSGTWRTEAWLPEWFGAQGKKGYYDKEPIQRALDAANNTDVKIVRLLGKTYYTNAPLKIYPYISVIGAEQKASWLYASQIMTMADCDAIQITSTNSKVIGVTLKNLIVRNGNSSDFKNVGIYIRKDEKDFGVKELRIENVQVLYFNCGIKADLYGNGSLASCELISLGCMRNNIGLEISGHYNGGKNGHKVWMNFNRFEFCRFEGNRVGGVYVHDLWNCMSNVFDNCCIESNGLEYSLSQYKSQGTFGMKFSNSSAGVTGGNAFRDCYFEVNIPRRVGNNPQSGEYTDGNYVYPSDFMVNKAVGNVILQQHSFVFENCVCSRNKNLVLLNDNSHVKITGTTVYDLGSTNGKDNTRYFIEFNDGYVPSSVISKDNFFSTTDKHTLKYFHFIKVPNVTTSKYNIKKGDSVDGGTVEINNASVKQLIK